MSTLFQIGVLAGIFICVLGFYFAVMMDRLRITYTRLYAITCIYFLLITGIVIYLHRPYFTILVSRSRITPVLFSIAVVASLLLLIYWAKVNLKRPTEFIERNPHQSFILLDYRYFLAKGCEILFQQSIVVLLALLLAQAGFSLITIMFLFAIIFSVAHVPLIFYDKTFWGWYYTAFSFIAGFIFPPLILSVNFGFLYALLIHWSFYALGGILFWFYNQANE